ncbi:uncharacterized protein THITE_2110042 [Thermothielavioides terrestris NRRL 8126]|uniref:Uncharacterized protein n=1 Tax=Thermothielavioides terrestris (strain ATCC 38088 / NRRL 8126) TaxID=578455 RepID=G2QRC3_THETT|nr:uncharacterized protein THITE_2110042 [Thermothielavioides terrestris NRRL 8126]AEO64175.1 hypothetical protein THITE_2110042 [Thermothielavioides terrestris NRRL 8126]
MLSRAKLPGPPVCGSGALGACDSGALWLWGSGALGLWDSALWLWDSCGSLARWLDDGAGGLCSSIWI